MCGIFAIVNKKPKKFDYPAFCTLGIANDSRGGDSCGVYIDGEVEYGVFTNKLFANYFPTSELLKSHRKQEISVAFGHCRKASVGAIDKEHAQPVVLKDKQGNTKFVLIHNGTIYNYEKLAKKYIPDIDIKGMTDSQVMARIFYYKGYDCLSEYYGGSVFVIADYRQPEGPAVYLFKGHSKASPNGAESDERPLYISVGKEELVVSSIDVFLRALRPARGVYTVEPNCLIKYTGKVDDTNEYLQIVKRCPRDKVHQSREDTVIRSYGSYYGGNWDYDDYGGWYGGGGRGGFQGNKKTTGKNSTQSGTTSSYSATFIRVDSKTALYMVGNKVAHGKLKISKYGRIIDDNGASNDRKDFGEYDVWFYNGIALRAERYYRFLEYLRKKCDKEKVDFSCFRNLIAYFSVNKLYKKGEIMVEATGVSSYKVYTGEAYFLGEGYSYRYISGDYTNIKTFKDYGVAFEIFTKKKDDGIILSKIQNTCKSLMK